jgi:hypothetical protein
MLPEAPNQGRMLIFKRWYSLPHFPPALAACGTAPAPLFIERVLDQIPIFARLFSEMLIAGDVAAGQAH